jgi:hypothetical protein
VLPVGDQEGCTGGKMYSMAMACKLLGIHKAKNARGHILYFLSEVLAMYRRRRQCCVGEFKNSGNTLSQSRREPHTWATPKYMEMCGSGRILQ